MASQYGSDQTEHAEGAAAAPQNAVERLIERFGGIRPMSEKIGVPVSTVQGWKKRGAIPSARQSELKAAAEKLGIDLQDAELDGAFRTEDRTDGDRGDAAESAEMAPAGTAEERAAVADSPADAAPAAASPSQSAAASPQAAPKEAPAGNFADAPSPVAALAHAYIHGPSDARTTAVPAETAPASSQDGPKDVPAGNFADAPSPVSALAHAYIHGPSDARTTASHNVPPPASHHAGGGRSGVAVVAAVLALVGAGAAVTAPVWSPEFLERSILVQSLDTRVADLESKLGVLVGSGNTLADRVTRLEETVASLDRKLAGVGALAARDLRAALIDGTPFEGELAAVRASGLADAATAEALNALAPFAATGIPTRQQVGQRFAWLVPTVAGADVATLDAGIGSRMWGWVSNVASVLRLPASTVSDPTSTPALMTRAAGMMDRGEIAAAADLVGMLQGPALEAATPWLAEARARVAADHAAALLGKRVAAVAG